MRRTFPSTRRAITLAVISGLSVTALSAAAQDEPVEEIVVTGSYFRGSPLDAPSPVQVIDRSSIEAQGAAVIWDVIKNLEVNSGSISNPGSGDNTQVSGSANVNLRNLGENSTLTLINGKRMVPAAVTTRSGGEFVDLNSIPLVMTDRVEVLTDGGSALYGADAVAGVVNIIMRNDFEGFELYGDIQGVQKADQKYDQTISAIWGWASSDGDTNLVLSAERFERDPVNVRETNAFSDLQDFRGTVSSVPSLLAIGAIGARFPAECITPRSLGAMWRKAVDLRQSGRTHSATTPLTAAGTVVSTNQAAVDMIRARRVARARLIPLSGLLRLSRLSAKALPAH